MRRSTIGGYQGPVVILTREDVVVAQAACRYRAEEDDDATDHWQGRLHRIEPRDAVSTGHYRVRFPTGEQAEIIIAAMTPGSPTIYFEGIGSRPLRGAYVAPVDLPRAEQARGTTAGVEDIS